MIAVILTGGKQYRVQEGDILEIEKIPVEAGRPFEFSKVLLIAEGDNVTVGTPFIPKAGVRAEVVEHHKGDKVLIFKKKRRKQYRRFKGHRQELAKVRITEILPDVSKAAEKTTPPAEVPSVKPPSPPPAERPAPKTAPVKEKKAEPVKKAPKPAKVEKPKAAPKKAPSKPSPKAKKPSS